MNKKNLILLGGVILVAGVGYYFWDKSRKKAKEKEKSEADEMMRAMESTPPSPVDSGTGVDKSPEQYLKEQMPKCTQDNGAMLAIRKGIYVPEGQAWARFGYNSDTEQCQLLGWMHLIDSERKSGNKTWRYTNMAELAEMAAYQLGRQKNRVQ